MCDFLMSTLLLLLGYAYPAFECFRTIEHNPPQIEKFRFWCQYWIILGLMSSVGKVIDLFLSGSPLYSLGKLAFIVSLWYPKTQQAGNVYNNGVRPFLSRYESEIDQKVMEISRRSGEWITFYIRNFTDRGQRMPFNLLHFVPRQTSGQNSVPAPGPQPSAPLPRQEETGGARQRPRSSHH